MIKFLQRLLSKLEIPTHSDEVHNITNEFTLEMLKLQRQAKKAAKEAEITAKLADDVTGRIARAIDIRNIQ